VAGTAFAVLAAALLVELGPGPAGVPAETRDWLLAAICAPLGARIAAYAPRNPCGWLILAVGALAAGAVGAGLLGDVLFVWLRDILWWPGYGLLIVVALLFPDGHPAGRGWRWVTAALVVATAAGLVALGFLAAREPRGLLVEPDSQLDPGWDVVVFLLATGLLLVGAVLAICSLAVRLRRAEPARRGPLGWAVANAALLAVALVLDTGFDVPAVWLVGALAIPLATTVGVLRYGLYDIDLLVHRSLSYGALTVAVTAGYTFAVTVATRVVPEAAAPVAAAATVMALLPLRQGIQNLVARALYGQGARPYDLMVALGRQIGLAPTAERILASAVAAIGTGLKLPYVAVHLGHDPQPAATHGERRPWPAQTLPLNYQGRRIGGLLVQQRGPDEPWSRRERTLLADIAEQLGPSAASVELTRDLQTARERLVRAREEELRRLRRDLHDGIGSNLAGARMLVHTARRCDEARRRELLDQLDGDLGDAVAEIRRVIDDLRPPALDRGLAAALGAAVQRRETAPVAITLDLPDGPDGLGELPAAVEVAVYRITDEALTNVVKHAAAARARVAVTRDAGRLTLTVDDDGTGIAGPRADGVGLESMAQRSQELGGTFEIQPLHPGTRLVATLPLV
jgi:signal transduction histidine kinase